MDSRKREVLREELDHGRREREREREEEREKRESACGVLV